MKIGIDIRAIGKKRTGDETYTENLIKNLLKIDQKNQYFFYTDITSKNEALEIKNRINPGNRYKNYQIISITPRHKMLWTFYSLPKYLENNPIDVLHVQYITPFFLPKGIKLITTIHDISFETFPKFISKKDLFFLKTLIPISLRRADKIIAVPNFTAREIERYFNVKKEKIKKVLNGVSIERFSADIPEDEIIKVEKKYNIKKPFVLYVGTLQPRKNIPFLLNAFEKLKNENENNEKIKKLSLVLAGNRHGHNYDKKIDTVIKRIKKTNLDVSKSIKLIGFVSEESLPVVYKSAEALVTSSLYEGFGLPIIEAMAAGTPVVYNDFSCFEEISGDAGLVYENEDENDFTKKIFNIIINSDLRSNLISKGKQRALFFSWEKCAEETLEIYKKVAQK